MTPEGIIQKKITCAKICARYFNEASFLRLVRQRSMFRKPAAMLILVSNGRLGQFLRGLRNIFASMSTFIDQTGPILTSY
jgi:3-dehydroquinate dehydratase